jgi:ketosteroid isomerase-like protein
MATPGTISKEKSARLKTCETLFSAMLEQDWETFKSCLSEDVMYRVGSGEPVYGPDAVAGFLQSFYTQVTMQPPDVRQVLEPENQVIFEFEAHYLRLKDNKIVNFACTDILRMKDDKIREWRVYVDMSPLERD